ncbi:hypothetical protein CC80DRAFT_506452 [Byssothecium circinans]|uniref:Uncharacterized protein n=1 Tax=Byssothecium circinans TaxID=147558 RepID=A0A6A5TR51_9PLEO|nr:hypothetical protein CC80DRAFT_506452 [Byssothecium circinans]
MYHYRATGSEGPTYQATFERDVAAINAVLNSDDVNLGRATARPLLRSLSVDPNVGWFFHAIKFASMPSQRLLEWRNCDDHLRRLRNLDIFDPKGGFDILVRQYGSSARARGQATVMTPLDQQHLGSHVRNGAKLVQQQKQTASSAPVNGATLGQPSPRPSPQQGAYASPWASSSPSPIPRTAAPTLTNNTMGLFDNSNRTPGPAPSALPPSTTSHYAPRLANSPTINGARSTTDIQPNRYGLNGGGGSFPPSNTRNQKSSPVMMQGHMPHLGKQYTASPHGKANTNDNGRYGVLIPTPPTQNTLVWPQQNDTTSPQNGTMSRQNGKMPQQICPTPQQTATTSQQNGKEPRPYRTMPQQRKMPQQYDMTFQQNGTRPYHNGTTPQQNGPTPQQRHIIPSHNPSERQQRDIINPQAIFHRQMQAYAGQSTTQSSNLPAPTGLMLQQPVQPQPHQMSYSIPNTTQKRSYDAFIGTRQNNLPTQTQAYPQPQHLQPTYDLPPAKRFKTTEEFNGEELERRRQKYFGDENEKENKKERTRKLVKYYTSKNIDFLAFMYREYLEINRLGPGEKVNPFYTNLLANEPLTDDEIQNRTDRAKLVWYAKSKWANYWNKNENQGCKEAKARMAEERWEPSMTQYSGFTMLNGLSIEEERNLTGGHLTNDFDYRGFQKAGKSYASDAGARVAVAANYGGTQSQDPGLVDVGTRLRAMLHASLQPNMGALLSGAERQRNRIMDINRQHHLLPEQLRATSSYKAT